MSPSPAPALSGIVRVVGGSPADSHSLSSSATASSHHHERSVWCVNQYELGVHATLLIVEAAKAPPDDTLRTLWVSHHSGAPLVAAMILGDASDHAERSLRASLCALGLPGDEIEILHAPSVSAVQDVEAALLDVLDRAVAWPAYVDPREEPLVLPVDDVFNLRAGLVASGRVCQGQLSAGASVELVGFGPTRQVWVNSVEVYRKRTDTVVRGEHVGVLLASLQRGEIARGAVLSTPGTFVARDAFRGRVQWFDPRDEATVQTELRVGPSRVAVSLARDGNARWEASTDAPIALRDGMRLPIEARFRSLGVLEVVLDEGA